MAISDIYTADSGMNTISVTTAFQPILELRVASTKRAFIVGCRMKVGVTSAAAGNDIVFTLARAAAQGTGGTTVNLRPHDASSATAFSTAFSPAYTTAPTQGNILAEWVLPQTTGSMWEEFPPLGYEWVGGTSTSIVGFTTQSVGTATPVEWEFVISE